MNTDPEPQEFEGLRRLLTVKRYEQAPPGYFEQFPRQVIERLRREAARENTGSRVWIEWLRAGWHALQTRSVAPAVFGAAACGLLVFGVVRSASSPVEVTHPVPLAASGAIFGWDAATPLAQPAALRERSTPSFPELLRGLSREPRREGFDIFDVIPPRSMRGPSLEPWLRPFQKAAPIEL